MAKVGDRVKETSATTGTGTLDLAGAPTGFRGFGDEFTSGDSVYYLCVDDVDNPTEYEAGTGTFTSGTPDTLSRDSVEVSSNGGSKVSWVAGCTVINTPPASWFTTLGDLFKVSAKTSAYSVVATDRNRTIDATSGTWTLSLLAAATATNGFTFAFRNSGTGVITIDPNSTETIDGATTITINQGESFLVVCDGTGWKTIGRFGAVSAATLRAAVVGPYFQAHMSGNQALTQNTLTKISFDTEDFDNNSNYDAGTNYRFTPTVAGKYKVRVQVTCNGTYTTSAGITPYIKKNGSTYYAGVVAFGNGAQIPNTSVVEAIISLNGSTDYVEAWVLSSGTTPAVVASNQNGQSEIDSLFSATFVGP